MQKRVCLFLAKCKSVNFQFYIFYIYRTSPCKFTSADSSSTTTGIFITSSF
jgi:hypothetical protein